MHTKVPPPKRKSIQKCLQIEKMDTEKGIWVPCGETNGKTPKDLYLINFNSKIMNRISAMRQMVKAWRLILIIYSPS